MLSNWELMRNATTYRSVEKGWIVTRGEKIGRPPPDAPPAPPPPGGAACPPGEARESVLEAPRCRESRGRGGTGPRRGSRASREVGLG